ncbi:MAG: hypothetical protein Q7S79_00785 [bacterium]|nr:hypothetical protein [bacterium]
MPDNTAPLRPVTKDQDFVKGILLPSLIILAVIFAGTGTGWVLAKGGSESGASAVEEGDKVAPGATVTNDGKEAGIDDEATFKDKAEGTLEEGGLDGEGTHKLIREGGPSKTAYLTSSVIDLDEFVGQKVEVWGETNKGIKAGWLMDVGRIKVLD